MSTSAKSNVSRKPSPCGTRHHINPSLRRPFPTAILRAAKLAITDYQIILWFEDNDWHGTSLELPGANAHGPTPTACVRALRQSMLALAAYALEQNETLPTPAREGLRSEQVNIRLSRSEKHILESRARQSGYKGLADYLRSTALAAP